MNYSPLIIIGAPRSGTNMLRDVLTQFPGVATWPCDEINYIWRHGNLRYPSDEFPADRARPDVRRYIRRQFDWVARRYGADVVVEKTCANSLRVPFVDRVVPEARYVFIHRDGLDAVGSAMARWKAPLDIPYLACKARFVPATDLPWYAARYFGSRIHRLFSREGRVGLWGPQLDDMDELLAERPLDEVCALQWRRCVEASAEAFASMPAERWLDVSYEDFVREPERELGRVLDFAGLSAEDEARRAAVAGVSSASLGKGRAALGDEAVGRLEPLVAGAMNPLEKES
ncbi:hypothetical protein KBTX_01966 [wastewater metagenome]|uniref:Sulfotransferase n=2 Tax=unclassified sequences TaxID=12908 RepID=A0A5B8RC35_9ZZZZ|nr:sulfotransferase [Arhodomonas sp. KWT]QEA05643.1 hypothetical protein KBTEX_01966 [uncultured organism]